MNGNVARWLDRMSWLCVVTAAIVVAATMFGSGGAVGRRGDSASRRSWTVMSGTTNASAQVKRTGTPQIALIEFSDFQCPFCGKFARETIPRIVREFVDSGRVAYFFRHFPLESIHTRALRAATAAECAGRRSKFWQMHDRMFANQQNLSDADLVADAASINLDASEFVACLNVPSETVAADQAEGIRLGITGTPTLMIGRILPNRSIELLKKATGGASYESIRGEIEHLGGAPSTRGLVERFRTFFSTNLPVRTWATDRRE
jgi:protein-disulfide isomerase